jgi:hypothetical protein
MAFIALVELQIEHVLFLMTTVPLDTLMQGSGWQ